MAALTSIVLGVTAAAAAVGGAREEIRKSRSGSKRGARKAELEQAQAVEAGIAEQRARDERQAEREATGTRAAQARRRRRATSPGLGDTVLTGPLGVVGESTTGTQKTLLGL